MSEMDLQARRDAAKADARAKRAIESADELRAKVEAPLLLVMQTVVAVIDALKRKGAFDATDLEAEVAQLRQLHAALKDAKNPFDFT